MIKEYKKCTDCTHHFLSIINIDKCRKSKTDLGHTVIYKSCSALRSNSGGCGIEATWFEAK